MSNLTRKIHPQNQFDDLLDHPCHWGGCQAFRRSGSEECSPDAGGADEILQVSPVFAGVVVKLPFKKKQWRFSGVIFSGTRVLGEDLCFPFFLLVISKMLVSHFFSGDEIWIYRAGVCFFHNGTSFPISSAARQVDGAINGKWHV